MRISMMRAVCACLALAGLSLAAFADGAAPIKGTVESTFDFEDGTVQGWHPRSAAKDPSTEKVALDATFKHGGAASLKVTERYATWNGPAHPLSPDFKPGATYHVTAWVGYTEGPATSPLMASYELGWKDPTVGHQYRNVVSVKATKGVWTQMEYDIAVPADPNLASVDFYFELPYKADASVVPDDLINFNIDDVVVTKVDDANKPVAQEDIPNLWESLVDYFPVGVAVQTENMDRGDLHNRLITKHFSALVAGNAMKPESLQPTEGAFSFAEADKIVDFAELTGKTMRGHTLVWHQQTPSWFFVDPNDPTKPASKELVLARLKNHIQTVVGHYKGRVYAWDVVNEVLSDTKGLRTGSEGSRWYKILGPDYIDKAFQYAHEADPKALLVINDYNLESSAAKRDAMYDLVKGMLARKIPVGAVGIQMHISIDSPSIGDIKKTIEKFTSLGIKVQITELDVSMYNVNETDEKPVTPEILAKQAARYGQLFNLFKAEAKKGLDMVMLWGASDDDSWLNNFPVVGRKNAPLLFDRALQAKPAFWAIVDPSKLKK